MSLNYVSGKKIANVFDKRENLIESVYYKEIDEKDKREVNNKLRINEKEGYIFPNIEKFDKNNEQTERLVVLGSSGSGKSTFIREYIYHWQKIYPKSPIFLFSSKKQDKTLDDIKGLKRVEIDDDILSNPITISEITMKKSDAYLILFDDIQSYSNKKIIAEVHRFCEECLMNGRSYGIYTIVSHHQPTDYRATRTYLIEATSVIIFPKRSSNNIYNYLLEKKLMLSKNNINLINTLNSNWVCIRQHHPTAIISDKYILI